MPVAINIGMHPVLEDPARSSSDFPRGGQACLTGPSYLAVSICAPSPPPPPLSCVASHALWSGCLGCREGRVLPRSAPRSISRKSPLRVVAATQATPGGTTTSPGSSLRHGWPSCHQYVAMLARLVSSDYQHGSALPSYPLSISCCPMCCVCVSLLCTSDYIGASRCNTLILLKLVLATTRQTPELLHRLNRSWTVLPTSVIRSGVALRGGCVRVWVCTFSCLTELRCHIFAVPRYIVYVFVCRLLAARRRPPHRRVFATWAATAGTCDT